MGLPGFLDLPSRETRPRRNGLTHVLDAGLPRRTVEDLLDTAGVYIDIWKLGWGTAYVDPAVETKLDLLQRHGVAPCVGGTLLEIAWLQGRTGDCLAWAADLGFQLIEVSNGAVPMRSTDKRRLISRAAEQFRVLTEVGSKSPDPPPVPENWVREMVADLEAGAERVIAEGRASGTVGLYRRDGSVREEVVQTVADHVELAAVIFEAPRKDQQAWFVSRYGPDVNLGNIPADAALGLETLRLGLRADTVDLHRQPAAASS